ncbi:hypothetical protein F0344_01565 [Streptomyces finlayi]|uniref:Uncharacterized protein n=1 Tax=Streptomyces finlayi TaxID=67296 RepID=A0A7G7BDR1_9ACTN|nr:hypothetical protein [Streptomyces finlayi]QNE73476.1 hypothetical protein F0344_01565 [Streptomyces finlayi]
MDFDMVGGELTSSVLNRLRRAQGPLVGMVRRVRAGLGPDPAILVSD